MARAAIALDYQPGPVILLYCTVLVNCLDIDKVAFCSDEQNSGKK